MASLPKEPPEDARKQSFWMVRIIFMVKSRCAYSHISSTSFLLSYQPGNYVRTVHRTERSFQACNDIVACFMERAKVEKQYAQQLSQWSSKWKSIVDSRKYKKLCHGKTCWLKNRHSQAFSHHLCSHKVKISTDFYFMSTSVLAWNFSVKIKVIISLLVPWLITAPCVVSFLIPSIFFLLPQGHFMAPSWEHGSVSSPPLSVCPRSILPFRSR